MGKALQDHLHSSIDKVAYLDFHVSPTGFFNPAMDSFAEQFTTAQKSLQDMHHFLPKRSSLAAGSNCQKAPSSQQPANPAPSPTQPQPKSDG